MRQSTAVKQPTFCRNYDLLKEAIKISTDSDFVPSHGIVCKFIRSVDISKVLLKDLHTVLDLIFASFEKQEIKDYANYCQHTWSGRNCKITTLANSLAYLEEIEYIA